MISCSEAVRQLWEYIEEGLDPRDRGRVDEHLAFCRTCCGEMEFARELRSFLADRPPVDLPPELETRFDRFISDLDPKEAR